MQALPHFLFSPHDLKTFLGLYVGVNPFRAPPGAMEIAENMVLRSQGVLESRRGFRSAAASPVPINAFGYKTDQKKTLAAAYDTPSLPAALHPSLGHRSRFAVYDWPSDSWAQAYMQPGALPFDRPRVGSVSRFMTA